MQGLRSSERNPLLLGAPGMGTGVWVQVPPFARSSSSFYFLCGPIDRRKCLNRAANPRKLLALVSKYVVDHKVASK